MTGALITRTACHSVQFMGRIENRLWRKGMYKIAKWRAMDRVMA